MPAWAKKIAAEGYEIGYYVRNNGKWGEFADNSTWLKSWLDKMSALGGNAQYVDVFARSYNGKPSEVLQLIEQGIPPNDVITEGWNDLYPFAGLLSGYHQADDWCSCCSPLINATYFGQCCNTTIYDMNPFSAANVERTHGSFINMVRLVMGDKVGFFGTEDSEYKRWGWKNNHFSERLAFITGLCVCVSVCLCVCLCVCVSVCVSVCLNSCLSQAPSWTRKDPTIFCGLSRQCGEFGCSLSP